MHNPDSVEDIEMHKLLWDFQIPTDYLIPIRWSDFSDGQWKKNIPNSGLFHFGRLHIWNKWKQKGK